MLSRSRLDSSSRVAAAAICAEVEKPKGEEKSKKEKSKQEEKKDDSKPKGE
jgi:hypothetical protein